MTTHSKNFNMRSALVVFWCLWWTLPLSQGFVPSNHDGVRSRDSRLIAFMGSVDRIEDLEEETSSVRRAIFHSAAVASGAFILGESNLKPANAAVGTLPEFADSNAIVQGLTVNVADQSQQNAMIDFLVNGLDFQVLRKRIKGSVEETVRSDRKGKT